MPALEGCVEKRLDQPIAEIVYDKFDKEDNVLAGLSKVRPYVISIKFRLIYLWSREAYVPLGLWMVSKTRLSALFFSIARLLVPS